MKQNTIIKIFTIFLLVYGTRYSYAIDPKFELDPKLLDTKLETKHAPPVQKERLKPKDNQAKKSHYPAEHVVSSLRKSSSSKGKKKMKLAGNSSMPSHQLSMVSVARGIDTNSLDAARNVWNKLIPPGKGRAEPFEYSSSSFSLSLDPEIYPILPAADGGKIVVDYAGTLPPLVKSLIQEKVADIRFVEESPGNRKRFFKSLLGVAGFYSVEEDFVLEFGVDPKITVTTDFKIEKNAESLLRQDVTLLNVNENLRPMPGTLVNFLHGKGFRVIEASSSRADAGSGGHLLYQVASREPKVMADSLLQALALNFDSSRNIDLYSEKEAGINLQVRADRYFESDGRHYVMSFFNGDPVTYTLIRLLETKGYSVIVLGPGDDFRAVSEKILSRLQISGGYGQQELWPIRDAGYGVQLSGVMIHDKRKMGRNIFMTDKKIDSLLIDLADVNGYRISSN